MELQAEDCPLGGTSRADNCLAIEKAGVITTAATGATAPVTWRIGERLRIEPVALLG
jgi:hypothetical protein